VIENAVGYRITRRFHPKVVGRRVIIAGLLTVNEVIFEGMDKKK
jgi:hypothetical protein